MRTLVLLTTLAVAAGQTQAQEPQDASARVPFRVVADWPQLPDDFVMGEAAGVDVDQEGDVWIFHRGKKMPIMEFDATTGALKNAFGGTMGFINAHGLEIGPENNVWVTDTRTHQVYKFSQDGEILLTVGTKGEAGMDATHFDQPTDVAITPQGDFYVTDGYGNNRVAKFDKEGKFLLDWGGRERGDQPGQFFLPHGITLGPDGKVYICDRSNLRIQVFTPDGEFIEEWKNDTWARPWGMEYVAADDCFYVMDGGHMRPPDMASVFRMNDKGEILESFGSFGTEPGQLSWGHDVSVGNDGAVYTVEVRFGLRVQKFQRSSSER